MTYNECLEELEKATGRKFSMDIIFGEKYVLTKIDGFVEKIFGIPHNINKFNELKIFEGFECFEEEEQEQMVKVVNKLIATGYMIRF